MKRLIILSVVVLALMCAYGAYAYYLHNATTSQEAGEQKEDRQA